MYLNIYKQDVVVLLVKILIIETVVEVLEEVAVDVLVVEELLVLFSVVEV
jgi:hypothetical protein